MTMTIRELFRCGVPSGHAAITVPHRVTERLALVWFVKLVTDPITGIIAYTPRYLRQA